MPAPVDIEAHYGDGSSEVIHETAGIWEANKRRANVTISTRKALQSHVLNGGIWMDADSTNNRWSQAAVSRSGTVWLPVVDRHLSIRV
jgi:hypothetical protein